MSIDIYGKLNNETVKKEYSGGKSDTANVIVNNETNTITAEVKKTPGKLVIQYDRDDEPERVFDGSEDVILDIPELGDFESLKNRVDIAEQDISNLKEKDIILQQNIDNEETARKNADITLQNNINAEANTRATADNTLQTNINNVKNEAERINLEEDTQEKGKLIFTPAVGNPIKVQGGFLPDNDTLELNTNNELTIKEVHTDNTITGKGTNLEPLSIQNSLNTKQNNLSVQGYLSLSNDILSTHFNQEQDDAINSGITSGKIMGNTSIQNPLTNQEFVNNSIATNTATFRGTLNIVSDLELSIDATEQAIIQALNSYFIQEQITVDNNDYCFVAFPDPTIPNQFTKYDRYKYDGTSWGYEFTLNNSSFTVAQWSAINSGINQQLVEKLENIESLTTTEVHNITEDIFYPTEEHFLTFSSPNSFTLSTVTNIKSWDGTLEYSTNKTSWTEWGGVSAINSSNDGKLYIRGIGNTVITGSPDARWQLTGSNISCTGNIETLLDYQTVADGQHPVMGDYCYNGMFLNCTSLTTAPELPATTLVSYCYTSMFSNCTSLTTAPALPATILAAGCYSSMFTGCESLATAPALPATTLAEGCYAGMFVGCTSLTTAPELPATVLAIGCYQSMFSGCTSLYVSDIQTPEAQHEWVIPTDGVINESTYQQYNMFANCLGTRSSDNFIAQQGYQYTYYTQNEPIGNN